MARWPATASHSTATPLAVRCERICIALNKPRGLVTTARDENGRDTVYRCFDDAGLPWLAPVGRLDRASEGLLLFSNDPEWAACITEPAHGLLKTYHVQIDKIPDAVLLEKLHRGEHAAHGATVLRAGAKNAWLESCSTKAATGRFVACWPRTTSLCCGWCAWRSVRWCWAISPRAPGAISTPRKSQLFRTPNSRPTLMKAAIARSRCSRVCAALICVRMRAWPFGTTGKKKPMA